MKAAYENGTIEQVDLLLNCDLSREDRELLAKVEPALNAARALQTWWEQAETEKRYDEYFTLSRSFNRSDESFGFFGETSIEGRNMPVMGTVEKMLYDQPKHSNREKLRREFREFVLHYFLRVTDFREPEAWISSDSKPPDWLREVSWCSDPEFTSTGFGYSQHFYKLRSSGLIGKFPEDQRFSIVDLRQLKSEYEWIVAKVRIFDFDLKFAPFGRGRPQFVVPLCEESYLVLSSDFLTDETAPTPDIAGNYGFGYAFIKQVPTTDLLAYGPGLFDAAFKRITFSVLRSGQTRVHLAFVANRPEQVLNVPFFHCAMQAVNAASLGMASRFLTAFNEDSHGETNSSHNFDPLLGSIRLANVLSGGIAARDFCISKEQLEKNMLLQHFRQHYQMLLGSLFTWRQVADWQDPERLPSWVVTGTSA